MIRVVALLRRAAGTDLDAFHSRLRDELGPLVAYHQATLGLARYVQSYRMVDPATQAMADARVAQRSGVMDVPFDATTEYWFRTEQGLRDVLASDAGRLAHNAILALETSLVEGATSPIWFAHEYPQVGTGVDWVVARDKSGVVKSQFPLRTKSDMPLDRAKEYWLFNHGPLIRSLAPAVGFLRYQQVHQYDSELQALFALGRGSDCSPFAGLAEAYFDRLSAGMGIDEAAATAIALEDESQFIDWTQSCLWNAREMVFVDRW